VGLAEAAGDGEAALGLGLGLAVLLPSPPQPPIEKASSPIVAKYKSLCIADRPQMLNFKISNKALQLQPVAVYKFICVRCYAIAFKLPSFPERAIRRSGDRFLGAG
jgi:hypothetical protein